MLNSNSKIKKSVTSALVSLTILLSALSPICCLRNSAAALGDTILQNNEVEQEDDFPFWDTYAYDDDFFVPVSMIPLGPGQYIGIPCTIC